MYNSTNRNTLRPFLAAILITTCCRAGWANSAGVFTDYHLQRRITSIILQYRQASHAEVGLHVINLTDGKTLCDIDADKLMTPASNAKILTSAIALKRLGRDFEFSTKLAIHGDDLVVIGDGDPATGDPRLAKMKKKSIYAIFDNWAKILKQRNIKQIRGNLVIEAGIFQQPYVNPTWPRDQLQKWYSAPVAGVNFNDNCFDIGFDVQDNRVKPIISPMSRFVRIDCSVRRGRRNIWACLLNESNTSIKLRGTVKASMRRPLPVAIKNPPMLFATILADRLARAGIEIEGKILISHRWPVDDSGYQIIATSRTPLADVIWRANKQSLNMMAECLFLRSAATSESPTNWERAAEVAGKVLTRVYELKPGQFITVDGSGLSRQNRATPAAITSLLYQLRKEKLFIRSLPIAGIDGTLRRRFHKSRCKGRIIAKTGSLYRVSALSGYIIDKKGIPSVAFSIIVNGSTRGKNYNARKMQEEICKLLIQAVDGKERSAAKPVRQKSRIVN